MKLIKIKEKFKSIIRQSIQLTILLFFLIKSVNSEIVNLSVEPKDWSKEQFPTIFYEITQDVSSCEYIIENIPDNTPNGDWKLIENPTGVFNFSSPLQTGEYEFWLRSIDNEGNKSEPKMVKIYVDTIPPPPPIKLRVEKIKDKYHLLWEKSQDKGSGIDYYEVTIDKEEPKIVKSEDLEINLTPGKTYNIKVRAVDKAGNEGEFSTLTYYLPQTLRIGDGKGVEIFKDWTISGYRSLVYRDSKYLKGNIGSSEGTTTGSTIEQSMYLTLRGLLPGGLETEATIEDIPAAEQNILIELKKQNKFGIKFGNLKTTLSGGEFTTLATKSVTGVEAFYHFKNINIKAITSQTKSLSTTEIRQGANIKGPYQIHPWIVEGSEQVKINDTNSSHKWIRIDPQTKEAYQVSLVDTLMIRDVDYVIDYISGEITFTNIVWDTATITVTFEYTLPFSANTGDFFGSQMDFSLKNNSKINLVYFQETANQSGALNTASVNNKPIFATTNYSERTKEYPLDNWPIVERTETVKVNQQVKNNELDYPGKLEGHYYIDYDRGVLRFKDNLQDRWEAPYRGEEINVNYNYYISFHSEETLSEDQKIDEQTYKFNKITPSSPNNKRIRVWLDRGESSERLLTPINEKNPKGDYLIDSKVTSIKFSLDFINSIENFSADRITVEYREIPPESGGLSQIKRTTWGINTSSRIGEFTQAEIEFAISQSDKGVYGTPYQESFKVNPESPAGPYQVSKTPLIPGKEVIKVNNTPKTRYLDYYIDYNKGEFYFVERFFVPQITDEISIEYRYLNPEETTTGITIIQGNAFKIRTFTNIKKLQLEGSYRKVQPQYLPAGANKPNPEDKNLFLRTTYTPNRTISLNSSFSELKKPAEIIEMTQASEQMITNRNFSSGFILTPAKFPKIIFNYQTSTQKDNLPKEHLKKQPDSESYNYFLNLSWTTGRLKTGKEKISTNINYSKGETSSQLLTSKSESETETRRINLELNPHEYVTINSELSSNKQFSLSHTPTSTSTTLSETSVNKFILNLRPANLYSITTSYDLQKTKKLPENRESKIIAVESGFSILKPLEIKRGKKSSIPIPTLTLNYSHREDPSSSPGGIITKSFSSYVAANLTKNLTQSFRVNFNSSKQAKKIGSDSVNYTIGYTYRPNFKKISDINLTQTFIKSKNYSLVNQNLVTTKTKSYTTNLGSSLTLLKNLTSNISFSFQSQKSPNNTSTLTFSLNNTYRFKRKFNLTNNYSFQKTSGVGDSKKHNITTGIGYYFTSNSYFSLDTNFVDYNDKKNKNNYSVISWILRVMLNF
jgi:hypothetical protein